MKNLRKVRRRFRQFRKICLNWLDTVEETLPERDARGPQATDLADIRETLPDPEESLPQGSPVEESLPQRADRGPQATDEAGDLFNVSGRTVRDAQKAP